VCDVNLGQGSLGVVGGRSAREVDASLVLLLAHHDLVAQARRLPHQDHEQAGGHGVERAAVPDLDALGSPGAPEPCPDDRADIHRGEPPLLVYQQQAGRGRGGLWRCGGVDHGGISPITRSTRSPLV